MEFLLVKFSGERDVIVDGADGEWVTNEVFQLQAGTHLVTLAAPDDFTPPQIRVVLKNTDVENPKRITFRRVPA